MIQTFQGLQPAIDFAQIESKKQNKKLFVFLTRRDGVQYMVTDAIGRLAIVGKLMGEYGSDPVIIKPIIPIPTPAIETKIEEKVEPVDLPKEVVAPIVEEEKTEAPIIEKPKKAAKKKPEDGK